MRQLSGNYRSVIKDGRKESLGSLQRFKRLFLPHVKPPLAMARALRDDDVRLFVSSFFRQSSKIC